MPIVTVSVINNQMCDGVSFLNTLLWEQNMSLAGLHRFGNTLTMEVFCEHLWNIISRLPPLSRTACAGQQSDQMDGVVMICDLDNGVLEPYHVDRCSQYRSLYRLVPT